MTATTRPRTAPGVNSPGVNRTSSLTYVGSLSRCVSRSRNFVSTSPA
jgi:hypothetical protein